MEDINTVNPAFIERACDGMEMIELSSPLGVAISWGAELDQLRSGNAPLLRQTLMEAFGISTMAQTPNGDIYMVPHDPSKPCVVIRPAGAG